MRAKNEKRDASNKIYPVVANSKARKGSANLGILAAEKEGTTMTGRLAQCSKDLRQHKEGRVS